MIKLTERKGIKARSSSWWRWTTTRTFNL